MKLTPILFVPRIEPALPFWTEKLGFTKTVEVPEGDHLGFVILVKDSIEVMMQTRQSIAEDMPTVAAEASSAFLFIEESDFDGVLKMVEGLEVIVPVRTTFYGMKEIGVKDPSGNLLCFAVPMAPQ